ncbi:MAG: response regulator [Elusimicrobia bacterium]|nr:response regulator [Elusimicrobiota bacterium]MDE2236360.1 response regulator [Elusimicrobiota bacterium]MDE2424815.1 response regulator [Elusimicrobiota bacterium]
MPKKILVCDDDPQLRETLRLLLSPSYDVLEARDGAEALRLIEDERPDLLLLDVSMPVMSGLETLKACQDWHPALATIMLSARRQIGVARRALALGARAYVTKPFDPESVRAEIDRVLVPFRAKPPGDQPPWRLVK